MCQLTNRTEESAAGDPRSTTIHHDYVSFQRRTILLLHLQRLSIMGNALTISAAGLIFNSIPLLVHGTEFLFPMHARLVVNYVLPPFNFQIKASPEETLTLDDQVKMLEAAIDAAPSEKWRAAADYIFVLTFEQRQGSSGFVASAIAALYAFTLPLEQRHPIHFMFALIGVFMTIGNLNHATGWPFLGYNPMVSNTGRRVGIAFTPFWIAATYCNVVAFRASKE